MGAKYIDNYNKHISIISKMLRKRFLNGKDIDKLREEIEIVLWLNGKTNYKIENFIGKIELIDKNYEQAITHFENAIIECDFKKPKASYYGLFRAYAGLEKYELALENLLLYDSCFDGDFNMNFYFTVLYKLLELSENGYEYEFKCCNTEGYVNCVKCPRSILKFYLRAEKQFENADYLNSLKNLTKFQEQCVQMNYPLDVSYLIKLVNKVYKLYNDKSKNKVEEDAKKLRELTTNEEKKKFLQSKIKDPFNVYALVELIKILIREEDFSSAYSLLNHKMDKKETEKYIKELSELRKIVYEEFNYEKNKPKIDEYLTKVEIFISEEKYDKAFKQYQNGYDDLGSPIFLFKIAELNYFIGHIEIAFKYFNKYLDYGEKFKVESYIYMSYIKLIQNKKSETTKYDDYLEEIGNYEKYRDVYEKAEDVYYGYIEGVGVSTFKDKDTNFNNYYSEIISSIKKGKIFRIETINDSKMVPDELALIKISAAPILLEQGAYYLSDKYYECAMKYSDDERIMALAEQYRKLRDSKNTE